MVEGEPVEESKEELEVGRQDALTDEQFARMEDEYDEFRRALYEGDEKWLRRWEEIQAFKEELRQWRKPGRKKGGR